jgi:hypothetical protein
VTGVKGIVRGAIGKIYGRPLRYYTTLAAVDTVSPLFADNRFGPSSASWNYETIDYDNVTVSRFRHNCQPPSLEIEGTATVTRKSPTCSGFGAATNESGVISLRQPLR